MSKARTWECITSRRLSEEMLLTGRRLPAGSWAAGLWTAPRWSGGWWACACSAGRKWWIVPFRGGPLRGQRWGPWCWCHSLGKPRWHSKCLPGALGGQTGGQNGKGKNVSAEDCGLQEAQANLWLHRTHCCISSAQISVCRQFCMSITVWSPNLEPLGNNHRSIMIRCQTYFRSLFCSFYAPIQLFHINSKEWKSTDTNEAHWALSITVFYKNPEWACSWYPTLPTLYL